AVNVDIRTCCGPSSNRARCPKRGNQVLVGSSRRRADATRRSSSVDASAMSSQEKPPVARGRGRSVIEICDCPGLVAKTVAITPRTSEIGDSVNVAKTPFVAPIFSTHQQGARGVGPREREVHRDAAVRGDRETTGVGQLAQP